MENIEGKMDYQIQMEVKLSEIDMTRGSRLLPQRLPPAGNSCLLIIKNCTLETSGFLSVIIIHLITHHFPGGSVDFIGILRPAHLPLNFVYGHSMLIIKPGFHTAGIALRNPCMLQGGLLCGLCRNILRSGG